MKWTHRVVTPRGEKIKIEANTRKKKKEKKREKQKIIELNVYVDDIIIT